MPVPRKNELKVKNMPTGEGLTERFVRIGCEAVSAWMLSAVLPATKKLAPTYSGPDPSTKYHPRGLIKNELGLETHKVYRGITIQVVGFPKASGNPRDPGTRAAIATHVLHRGWTRPKARTGHQVFAVWKSELRNPRYAETPPPPGVQPSEDVAWIYTYRTAPHGSKKPIVINRFYSNAVIKVAPQLQTILNRVNAKYGGRQIKRSKKLVMRK